MFITAQGAAESLTIHWPHPSPIQQLPVYGMVYYQLPWGGLRKLPMAASCSSLARYVTTGRYLSK